MEKTPEVIASNSASAREHWLATAEMRAEGMLQTWRNLEGQVVGGKFRLAQYLGGSDCSAVFLTERPQGEPLKTAIKLIAANPEKAAGKLSRWAEAEKMSHPHLLRLFEMGRCHLNGEDQLYLVMEYAEENLSQVVAARPLTPGECQQMLLPVLEALAYIHGQGYVHGHIKPANIMASEERVKLSCDGLTIRGESSNMLGVASVYDPPESATEGLSPAGDVWSLGMTLAEVLTQKLPVLEAGRKEPSLPRSVPPALAEIIGHCLRLDPRQRWTVDEIKARLAPTHVANSPAVESSRKPAPVRKNHAASVIAIALLAGVFIGGWLYTHHSRNAARAAQSQTQPSLEAEGAQPVKPPASPIPATTSVEHPSRGAVMREVLPKVPKSARDTIHGTIRVKVRVMLDQAGNVAHARFDSTGPSKYFARQALQAAVGWKFVPPQPQGPNPAREWMLQFQFRRNSVHVIPSPLAD